MGVSTRTRDRTRREKEKVRSEGLRAEARAEGWADRIEGRLPPPVRAVVERARTDDVLVLSSSLAFYALISVAPMVLMVIWVTSLVLGDQRIQELAKQIGQAAPKDLGADRAVTMVADQGTRIGVVAIVAALWPATSYGAGLSRAFDRLSPKRHREMRGLRGRGLVLLVLLPLFVIGGLAASFVGLTLLGEGGLAAALGWAAALVFGFVGSAVAVALILRIFPPDHLGWSNILRGTGVTAAGVSILSLLFTASLNSGANFGEYYASSGVATVVLLAVWLFLSNVMLLVGYKIASGN